MDVQKQSQFNEQSMEELKAKCEEYLAGWKRAQADYANLKKVVEREKAELVKYANERLLYEILPAVDQFEAAMRYAPDLSDAPEEVRKKLTSWLTGLNAVKSIWLSAFQAIGLIQVSCDGAFDPRWHEAVGEEAAQGQPEGNVLRCVEPGWVLNGKLLRPAKVIVAVEGRGSVDN